MLNVNFNEDEMHTTIIRGDKSSRIIWISTEQTAYIIISDIVTELILPLFK